MAVNGEIVDSVNGILNNWLLDFITFSSFQEFAAKRTVEDSVCRDLISGVLKRPLPDDTQTNDKKCITVLLCRLADGEDFLWMADSNDGYDADEIENKTTLEDGISFLEDLLERHNDIDDVDEVILRMRCEAVYVCCRGDDFDIAQEVFDRIWKTSNKPSSYNEKSLKKKIQAVIDSGDSKHPDMQLVDYSKFVDQAVRLLGVIMHKIFPSEPFLLQAAKTVLEKEQKAKKHSQTTGHKVRLDTSEHKGSSKNHSSSKKRSPKRTRSRNVTGNVNNNSTAEEQSMLSGSEPDSFHSTKSIPLSKKNTPGSRGVQTRSGRTTFSNRNPKKLERDSSQNSDTPKTLSKKTEKQATVTTESHLKRKSRKLLSSDSDDNSSSGSLILSSQYKPPVAGQPTFKREVCSPVKEEDSVSDSNPRHTSTPSRSKHMKLDQMRGSRRQMDSDSDTEEDDRYRDGIRKYRYKKNVGRPDRHNESKSERKDGRRHVKEVFDFVMTDGDSDFNEIDDLDQSLLERIGGEKPKKLHMRQSLDPAFERNNSIKGSSRKKWTNDEEERLYEAIVEFGVGNWAKIKETYGFIGRSQVQLKDKWRTILKQGRHKVLMTKYGRVSGIDYF